MSIGAASYALSSAGWQRLERASARHLVLLMNPRSGGGKAERFGLADLCRQRNIEPIVLQPGDDLRQLAEDAVAHGADVLGMAGGDGSQALVASVASEHSIPFVVVPAGTRNHFALDLGLDRDDVPGALDAYEDGVDTVVDLAEVNGRVFVNNASMGVYAKIVQSADYGTRSCRRQPPCCRTSWGRRRGRSTFRFTLPSGRESAAPELLIRLQQPVPGGTAARWTRAPRWRRFGGRLRARGHSRRRREARRAGARCQCPALCELERLDGLRVRGALPDPWRSVSTARP